jgi:ribosomal-protein-alanine N-acetyltransferase
MMDLPSKLKIKDIYLRLINSHDVKNYYVKWLNDREVTKHTDQIKYKHTIKSTKKYVNKILSSKNSFLYGIFFADKSKKKIHIGNIKIGPVLKLHQSAYISYLIGDKRFWNKNVGTLVIKKIKKICKSKHKLKKICAGVSELNKASAKILLKNGFKLEGVFRKHIVFNNKRYNLLQYGISI